MFAGLLHVDQVRDGGGDAAQDAGDELDIERIRDAALAVVQMGVVQVADIVSLELRLGTALLEHPHDAFQIGKGVAEDKVPGHLQVAGFPVVSPLLELVQHREEREVHGPQIAGGQFGLVARDGRDALLHAHVHPAARADADHRVALGMDGGYDLTHDIQVAGGHPGLRVPGVHVDRG